ncbi:FtsX-like permease family protein [Lentibacillus salicampi]|uniref:ABC transporter permease n=1 Tax=Lentibacillus salicampi TaxID=175306 RepID=A0A4Y9A9I9_9BACI|nr:ABC transporter permease [Lentibacillus salicampi]TFJ91962.1 ABC transporter permease [Lentibacillus salicampi]
MKMIKKQIRKSILARKLQVTSVILFTILIAIAFNYLVGGMMAVDETYQEQRNHSETEDFRMLPELEPEDYLDNIANDYDISGEDLENLSWTDLVDKYSISLYNYDEEIVQSLSDKYNFDYTLYEKSVVKEDNITYFLTPYDKDISNFTIEDGAFPEEKEVSLTYQYAKQKNIAIGDEIDILGDTYTVSGLHTGPLHNFLYSDQYSESVMITSNAGVIMNKEDFRDKEDIDKSYVYLGKFDDTEKKSSVLSGIKNDDDVAAFTLPKDVESISNIENDINTNTYIGIVAIVILFLTVIVIQIMLIRNELYQLNPDFGILLSIGVNKRTILQAFNFYMYLLLSAVAVGSIIGVQLQQMTFSQMQLTYNIQQFFSYNWVYSLLFGIGFLVVIMVLIYSSVIANLRHKPLNMINRTSSKKNRFRFLKGIKKWNAFRPFTQKIKSSFTFKNIGFLFTLVFSIIIVFNLFLLGWNLITSNEASYETYKENIRYESINILSSTQTDGNGEEDIGYSGDYSIDSNNHKEMDDTLTVMGIRDDNPYYRNIDVEENTLIINKKFAHDHQIDTSDSITIDFNGESKTINIEVNSNAFDQNNYMLLEQLWDLDEDIDDGSYNFTFNHPSDSDVSYSTTKNDQIELLDESLLQMNSLLTILFMSTTIISAILLILIANSAVNENTSAIKIFLLLGYNFRKIFFLSVDVFKIQIIVSALLALCIHPFITKLLERIINNNSSSIYIEINFSILTIFISIVVILAIYYIVFIWNYLIHIRKINR